MENTTFPQKHQDILILLTTQQRAMDIDALIMQSYLKQLIHKSDLFLNRNWHSTAIAAG